MAATGGAGVTTPQTSTTSNSAALPNPTSLYGAIPNLNNLVGSASGNIMNLLSGLPSAPLAQTTAAYAGATAGQPGQSNALGTFIGNAGANLYNQQSSANQQTGLGDLLNLIGGTSGTLAPTPGQNLQNSQYYAGLGQSGSEFQQSLAEQQFNDQINALIGLSNAGIGGTGGTSGSLINSSATASPFGNNTTLANLEAQLPSSFPSGTSYNSQGQSTNGSLNALIQNILAAGGTAPYGTVNGAPVTGIDPYSSSGFSTLY
jgi:hypothetical protein